MPVNFVTLPSGAKPDSSQFQETRKDVSLKATAEDGYEFTRPRTTRTAQVREWRVAYRELTRADYDALNAFWDQMRGGAVMFNWTDPSTQTTYTVRFSSDLAWNYTGIGARRRWDCSFAVKTV